MYDSILYGNGLSIRILNELSQLPENKASTRIINMNDFVSDLITMPIHKRSYRDFMKAYINIGCSNYRRGRDEIESAHEKSKQILSKYLNDINSIGFERFISKYLFKNKEVIEQRHFLCLIYNYWYHCLEKEVLQIESSKSVLSEYSRCIKQLLNSTMAGTIFTVNFDKLLDNELSTNHIHGKFVTPHSNFEQLIAYHYEEGDKFEWNYLFGAGGMEKLCRITEISKRQCPNYDLAFFFDEKLALGHLLIFGVAFSATEYMKELHNVTSKYDNTFYINCVDGHIVSRLVALKRNGGLSKMTITYYCEADLVNYQSLFRDAGLSGIVEYKHCSVVIP